MQIAPSILFAYKILRLTRIQRLPLEFLIFISRRLCRMRWKLMNRQSRTNTSSGLRAALSSSKR
jgi:hypothetical protein